MLNSYYTENILGSQDVKIKENEKDIRILLDEELLESEYPHCHNKTKLNEYMIIDCK